jgi:hypothetical protein
VVGKILSRSLVIAGRYRGRTYTWEFDTAITAFGSCAFLLDVQKSQAAARGLDDTDLVGASVVSVVIASISNLVPFVIELSQGPIFLICDTLFREMEIYEGNVRVAASVLQALGGHCDGICRCGVKEGGRSLTVCGWSSL